MILAQEFSVGESLSDLYKKLGSWFDAIILKLPNFILAVIVFIIFVIVAKYIGKLIYQLMLKKDMQHSIRQIMVKVTKAVVILIGFFIALGILDLNKVLTSVLAGAGVAGLAIGLALQGTLNNTFSGLLLSFVPEIKIHDWIETNDHAGEVLEVSLRNTTLREADNNHVIIPNSKITEGIFKNYSTTKRSRVTLDCGVGYEEDLEEVEKLTREVIGKIFEQRGDKEVVEFYMKEFGDSSMNFMVRFWVDASKQRDIHQARHKAVMAIKKAFDARGINIPFPIRTLDFGKNKFRSETLHISNNQNQ